MTDLGMMTGKAALRLAKTGVAINSGHVGNSGNRVIGLASRDVMKNFEAENFARDSVQIDRF